MKQVREGMRGARIIEGGSSMKKLFVPILSALMGFVFGIGVVLKVARAKIHKTKKLSDKHLALFLAMNQWVKIKQEGKNLASYFEKNGYKKIAIYGMSYVGKTLLKELKTTKIQVIYGIDKSADTMCEDIDIFSLEDNLEIVDVVVVTAITFFDEIKEILTDKVQCPIISLEDILYEL